MSQTAKKSLLGDRVRRGEGHILIAVNGGSIAHSMRPVPLGQELQRRGYKVSFAGDGPYLRFVRDAGFSVHSMPSLSYQKLLRWQKTDRMPLYGWGEFEDLLRRQRAQLEQLKPDLAFYDGPDASFALAANSLDIPVLNIANASTFGLAGPTRYVTFRPHLRRWLGDDGKAAQRVDKVLHVWRNIPLYISAISASLRRRHLDQLGYTGMLMPDLPQLFDLPDHIGQKTFVGPMLYEPPTGTPSWWPQLDADKPLIYIAVGSSGGETGLQKIIEATQDQPWQVILSTSGHKTPSALPANFFAAPFVPREQVLRRAALMIFHGGNASSYQAIKHAVPMLAIPGHFDQDLMARTIVRKGLGLMIMPHQLQTQRLRAMIEQLLDDGNFARSLKDFQPLVLRARAEHAAADIAAEILNNSK